MRNLDDDRKPRWPVALWLGATIVAAAVCTWRLNALDLRVYYWAARSFFIESGPMYGGNAHLGWPMLYRYPPLFLCLFRPLALLPLRAAAGVWAAFEILLLGWLLRNWYRQHPPASPAAFWIPALIVIPYLAEVLRGGNVQLLIVVLVSFALLESDGHPILAGALLGLAAAFKVWPAFLAPYLVLRRRWRAAVSEAVSASALTITPAMWLGWHETWRLLEKWYAQEKHINAVLGDRWYPSQSLRGVMLRLFTHMNYSGLPDSNYRLVNFVSWPSFDIRYAWLAIAILLGLASMFLVWQCRDNAVAYAIFFCFLLIIQPNVAVQIYITLLWPALVAGKLLAERAMPRGARLLTGLAAAFAVAVPLLPGSATQRLLQVLGLHFFLVLLPLTLAIVIHALGRPPAGTVEAAVAGSATGGVSS